MTKPIENQSTYSCMILYTFFFICCPEVIRMYAFCQLGNREPFGRGGIEFSQAWQTCLCFLYTPTLKFYRKIESLWLAQTTQQKPNSSHRNHPACLKLVQVRSFDMQISMFLGQSTSWIQKWQPRWYGGPQRLDWELVAASGPLAMRVRSTMNHRSLTRWRGRGIICCMVHHPPWACDSLFVLICVTAKQLQETQSMAFVIVSRLSWGKVPHKVCLAIGEPEKHQQCSLAVEIPK